MNKKIYYLTIKMWLLALAYLLGTPIITWLLICGLLISNPLVIGMFSLLILGACVFVIYRVIYEIAQEIKHRKWLKSQGLRY